MVVTVQHRKRSDNRRKRIGGDQPVLHIIGIGEDAVVGQVPVGIIDEVCAGGGRCVLVEVVCRVGVRRRVRRRPEAVADGVIGVTVAVRPYRRGRKFRAAVVPPPSMSCRCHRFPFARLCVYLLLDVGELGVVLVVLLALRAVDRCVERSFHGSLSW